ncbi:hypothetical protein QKU48_gp0319 [Fadolivirus algeromassiliense]|jgi:hypothetical protein|uniref:Uncharacterized protein n=1 Tax=Fadolivirus FV1/VV64 TaxID=3070911 RepID=A0A7D3V8M8_9VIRU|nr:hypothetical protein QKU48_gp0319 [Fadolivirus algeromassiliense]QKF93777.1 hypothetical protein Fadolivirus_1_319 [Fadolivirus FV1/VV64]
MSINRDKKDYQISKNGRQCIGPCYEPNKWVVHPLTLSIVTNNYNPFCTTKEWFDEKGKSHQTDECYEVSADGYIDVGTFMIPESQFTCQYFLKTYYNIISFESAIEMILESKNPMNTNLRILNCAWKVYGSSVDIINDNTITFYINLIKKEWIRDIYPVIYKYINIDGSNIYLKENDDDINKYQVEKINYFNKKINQPQMIYKILYNYIDDNKSDWNNINDHNKNIKKYLINYIKDKIFNTINASE